MTEHGPAGKDRTGRGVNPLPAE